MKNIIFSFILLISVCVLIFGVVKKNKKIRQIGYGGLVFLIVAVIGDFIDYLNL